MNRRHVRGMTLIELLVAMVLGLIVVGGVIGVMMANKRSYTTNNGLAQVQESARTAFELMARDIRQSAGNGCDTPTRTSNLLKTSSPALWWETWWGMTGVENGGVDPAIAVGTAAGERVAGTDTIHVQGLEGTGMPIESHDQNSLEISLNFGTPTFGAGDIMIICDFDHASIFQTTAWAGDSDTQTLTHDVGSGTPGNCSSGLGFPAICDGGTGQKYPFQRNALIGRLQAAVWYVGNNGRPDEGGRSLFRRRLGPGGVVVNEELVAGVTDLQVRYGESASNKVGVATAVGNWADVNSIFITLKAESADTRVTTDDTVNNGRITRTFTYLVTLRNRVQ